MKKFTTLTAVIISAIMLLSLAACSNSPQTSQSVPSFTFPDSGSGSVSNEPSPTAAPANSGSDSPYSPESLGFTTEEYTGGEFVDGYAWVSTNIMGDTVYELIDRSGKIVYISNRRDEWYGFEKGYGFIADKIIDQNGNVTYTARNDDEVMEEILAQCGDKFAVRREYSTFDNNSVMATLIDSTGKDLITPFESDSKWTHFGEGYFFGYNQNDRMMIIINSSTGEVFESPENYRILNTQTKNIVKDGKIWMGYTGNSNDQTDKHPAIYDLNTKQMRDFAPAEKDFRIIGSDALIDEDVYNINGERFAAIPIYTEYAATPITHIGEYNDKGCVPVRLQGKDRKQYITYLDSDGNEMFTPVKLSSTEGHDSYNSDQFAVKQDDSFIIYDHTGAQKTSVKLESRDADETTCKLYDDYLICNGHYYFF